MISQRFDSEGSTPGAGAFNAPRPVWWTLFFLLWTLQAGLFAFADFYRNRATGTPVNLGELLLLAAVDWYQWGLICLLCFWVASRLPLEKYSLRVLVPALTACTLAITVLRGIVDELVSPFFGWVQLGITERIIRMMPGRFILVMLFIALGYAIEYIRRHRERELKAAHLRAELADAQLQMLKVQLQPHFLFNTLHAVSSLMYIDVEAADRMLVRLSELLRRTLQTMDAQLVTLAEELSFIEPYVEIERIRLAERLEVEVRIEPGTRTALVPHLILQPLVENAIRHGISPSVGGGTLTIAAETCGGSLVLSVADDGVGLRHGTSNGSGVGLTNTRERLRHLYGDAGRLDLEARADRGVLVTVELPLTLSDTPVEAAPDPIRPPLEVTGSRP